MRPASRHSGKRRAETQYSAIRKKIEAEESSSASQKGTRRTASLPAWAMRSAHCPLRQRIVRMPIIEEDSRRRENEERVAQYNYFTARASNRSAWARAGMG